MTTFRDVPAKTDPAIPGPPRGRQRLDVQALEGALRQAVVGEVRFDRGARALYANDASNFRQVPIGVVVPETLDDVVAAHRVCHEFRAPILSRGGGTSLSGETVNYAVVIDHSKQLTRVDEPDLEGRTVMCENGVINEDLNRTIGRHGLIFGPDPSTHSRCTIGGNIGNNSCGIHSVQSQLYGPGPRTSDNVEALEIVTYDGQRFWVGVNEEAELERIIAEGGRKGEIYARLRDLRDRYAEQIRRGFPSVTEVPRRVSGFNLDELLPENGFNVARALVGTEGTCVSVLRAQLKLTPALVQRTLVVVGFDELVDAAAETTEIVDKWRPIGLEVLDRELIEDQRELDMHVDDLAELPHREGNAWLLVQFGADHAEESIQRANDFVDWLSKKKKFPRDRMVVSKSVQEGGNSEDFWKIREGGLGSTAFAHGRDAWPGWEDSAVPPERIGEYVHALRELMNRHNLHGAMYGHLAQGCIHSRIDFDLRTRHGVLAYRRFLEEAADLVCSFGGSLSGEHGDGQQRAELLDRQYGRELVAAMREFKLIWDPDAKMNPGKVVDAYRLDENLKLGPGYNLPRPATKFAYEQDSGDFAHAALRCVGIGKCRVPHAETTMCPSFQVTREEEHTTRGRARMLFEMLQGEVITDGWQSREVADSLELCLACKGCTNDCPVNVDMPTYKAEFRHHHYRSWRRWRPRHAYVFGFIDQTARLAARMPELVNAITRTPGLARLARWAGGIDQARPLPEFAPMTLQQWFRRRGTANPHGRPVVVFPDTFTNHLHTDVGVACVEAIEAAGWRVIMPEGHVCCGRPLYDYGFLDMAERYLRRVVDRLRDHVRDDVPVVGLEPSCMAVFKDELIKMLPHDDDARRLAAGAYHFAEFFDTFDIPVPRATGKALQWTHCHQRATGGPAPEEKLLRRMGLTVEGLSGGCCGLAGSWGFENGKYGMSMDCGEQALLPAVRKAEGETMIVADGFSCATQIADAGTGRAALHSGQVVDMAAHGHRRPRPKPAPSTLRRVLRTSAPAVSAATVAAGAAWAARWAVRKSD